MTTLSPALRDDHARLADQERLLSRLTEQLADAETDFATLNAEFGRFQLAYLRRFAPLYRELDGLEAEIAKLQALDDDTPAAQARAEEATSRAAASEEAAGEPQGADRDGTVRDDPPRNVDPDLRQLYRQAAKAVHPDTANSDEERRRRTQAMAEINAAYQRGDADAIRRIMDGPTLGSEPMGDLQLQLARIEAKIAHIKARLKELAHLRSDADADPMWRLYMQCRDAWLRGEDPLVQDEKLLRGRIASATARLEGLRTNWSAHQRGATA